MKRARCHVLSDSTFLDEASDGGLRGEQKLLVDVKSGQYTGKQLLVQNYVGPLYGVPVKEGDGVALIISTYSDGESWPRSSSITASRRC